jgi:hypothetical protein
MDILILTQNVVDTLYLLRDLKAKASIARRRNW